MTDCRACSRNNRQLRGAFCEASFRAGGARKRIASFDDKIGNRALTALRS